MFCVNCDGKNAPLKIDQRAAGFDINHIMPLKGEVNFSIVNRFDDRHFLLAYNACEISKNKNDYTRSFDSLSRSFLGKSLQSNAILTNMATSSFSSVEMKSQLHIVSGDQDTVPSFKVTDARGKTFTDQDLQKGIFLLDFWGTWCRPCIESMPKMVKMAKKFDGNVQFISYAMEINSNDILFEAAEKKYGISWVSYYETRNQPTAIADAFKISGFPTYILVKDGVVLKRSLGAVGVPQIESMIERLLKKDL
jgi:thiol-disulfide isomerase/thioredoxin